MSATDSRVAQLQREIQALHKTIAEESATCAKERDRIIKAKNSLQRTSSAATRASVERAIAQAETSIQKAEKKRAGHEKALASKVGDLHKAQGKQAQERLRSQQDALKRLEASTRSRQPAPPANWLAPAPLGPRSIDASVPSPPPDLFVAHASEDKDEVARPLAEALREAAPRGVVGMRALL
jgi:DNA repair exonuclease SbcCD ATPase subunit